MSVYGIFEADMRCECGKLISLMNEDDPGNAKCFGCDTWYDVEVVVEEVQDRDD